MRLEVDESERQEDQKGGINGTFHSEDRDHPRVKRKKDRNGKRGSDSSRNFGTL